MDRYWEQPRRVPFRSGLVTAQQLTPFPAVRVQFPDRDGLVSYWLPIASARASAVGDFFYHMPDIGDQVSVIMDEHNENGYVSGSLPSNVDITPVGVTLNKTFFIQTKDGTTFQYDRSTSSYSVAFTDAAGSISITMQTGASFTLASDGTLTLQDAHGTQLELDNAGNCYCSGNLRVKGTITEGFGTGATVGVSTHQHGTGSAAAGTVAPTPNT